MTRTLVAALVLAVTACDKPGPTEVDPVVTPTPIDPATAGTVKGRVLFAGPPPKQGKISMASECAALHEAPVFTDEVLVADGRLRNVLVYIKEGLETFKFDWPRTPACIANTKCVYVPRVVAVQVNQPIDFANDDVTVHNIHAFSGNESLFNFSLQGKGSRTHTLRAPVTGAKLKCDIHPWMLGWLTVLPHPFFQLTGPDGAFELKGLPPGDYVLEAWHEKYGAQTRKAKLDPKGALEVEFSFSEK